MPRYHVCKLVARMPRFNRVGLAVLTAGAIIVSGCGRIPEATPIPTPPPGNSLVFSGPLVTDSSKEMVGSGEGCSVDASSATLHFETNAMSLEPPSVARLVLDIPVGPEVRGRYSATTPLGAYGFTPVRIVAASTATTGVGSPDNATSGHVTVDDFTPTRTAFWGSVQATFADGSRVEGGWVCIASS
jgi:hypothetical protein